MFIKSKKNFVVLFISTLFLSNINFCLAQEDSAAVRNLSTGPSFWDRVYFGGGLGLQFGDQTVVQVAPIAAYKVTEKFHVGVGVTYIYYNLKQYYYDPNGILQYYKYSSNVYGGSLFAKYFLFDEIFAYGEYGLLNMEIYNPIFYNTSRQNINSMLLGGGYMQMVGRSVGVEFLLLYDVIGDPNSPYSNPTIRIGIVAGF